MIPAAAVVAAARGWLGVPYRHQGRSRTGVDCIGLVIVAARDAGAIPPDFDRRVYSRLPHRDELLNHVRENCHQLEVPQPGAMVVIQWTKQAAHVALVGDGTLVHAYQSVGEVVEHGYRGRWLRMTHSTWKLPGVSYV